MATVDWTPAARNAAFAAEIGPLVLAALSLRLGLALHAFWRSSRQTPSLVESEQRALEAALRDVTTGLPNRAHMDMRLQEMLTAGGVRLHIVGLDRFKVVNETFGARIGDEILRAVADLLATLAVADVFLARMGGDEFALACPDRPDQDLCDAIFATFADPFATSIGPRTLVCSVGTAIAQRGSPAVELVRRADLALLRAKMDGRGVARTYDRALDDRIRARERLPHPRAGAPARRPAHGDRLPSADHGVPAAGVDVWRGRRRGGPGALGTSARRARLCVHVRDAGGGERIVRCAERFHPAPGDP